MSSPASLEKSINESGASIGKQKLASRPSDDWDSFSDSDLSVRHLAEQDKEERTSTPSHALANLLNMYIGIAMISVSKIISLSGIYTALVGFFYVTAVSVYTTWLLIKARNRFKTKRIVDIGDLTAILYGESKRKWTDWLLVVANIQFLMCYTVFIGEQFDIFLCKTTKNF